MPHYAIVIDSNLCTGCLSCEVACKQENGVALGQYWNKVILRGPEGDFPHLKMHWIPSMCQQCAEAPCVHVCPTGASYRDEKTNIVLINKEDCIGCQYCMMACPYGVRSWNKAENVVEKCTLCTQLTSNGELPACVSGCPGHARFYGDLDDPESDASKRIAAADPADVHVLEDVGNHPQTKYILSPRIGEWKEG